MKQTVQDDYNTIRDEFNRKALEAEKFLHKLRQERNKALKDAKAKGEERREVEKQRKLQDVLDCPWDHTNLLFHVFKDKLSKDMIKRKEKANKKFVQASEDVREVNSSLSGSVLNRSGLVPSTLDGLSEKQLETLKSLV